MKTMVSVKTIGEKQIWLNGHMSNIDIKDQPTESGSPPLNTMDRWRIRRKKQMAGEVLKPAHQLLLIISQLIGCCK